MMGDHKLPRDAFYYTSRTRFSPHAVEPCISRMDASTLTLLCCEAVFMLSDQCVSSGCILQQGS